MALKTIRLRKICHARSGDKTNKCNVGLIASEGKYCPVIAGQVTAACIKKHFAHFVKGRVARYAMENIKALNFTAYEALNGGATSSIQVNNLGKLTLVLAFYKESALRVCFAALTVRCFSFFRLACFFLGNH